jgi:hypothetical protein
MSTTQPVAWRTAKEPPPPNTRIRLVEDLPDDPDPIPGGATGVVVKSHPDVGQIGVLWDPPHEHRRLFLLSNDPWEVIQDGS